MPRIRLRLFAWLTAAAILAACSREHATESTPQAQSAATPKRDSTAFPLHVEPGKRYLVDASGKPFFINGDTPWSLAVQLTREQVDRYLDDRKRKRINAVLFNLIEHYFADRPPTNAYGDAPFATAGDFAAPNEAYFAHVDYVVRAAASRGILVMLAPAYLGYDGGVEGWYAQMIANGPAKLFAYGEYVGHRYRSFDNILWVQGGDFAAPDRNLVRAVADGIRKRDGKPHTFHAKRHTAAMELWGTNEPWLTVNNIYTDEKTVVASAFTEYKRSTAPFFLIEARYEGEQGATQHTVRLQAYQAALSGASGHMMGNNPIWGFGEPRQCGRIGPAVALRKALDSPGARSLVHLADLIESRAWWVLEPDIGNTTLTAGIGIGADRAVAARARDGSFALVYIPTSRTISIDFGRLAGPNLQAWWYDPADGSSRLLPGSPFPATGSRSFTPPRKNSSNFGDWLLIVESTS